MPSVLLLGARAPVALDHARRFSAQGWRVVVADSGSCRLSGWSNAVARSVALPSPRDAPAAFAAALAEAVRTHAIDLVVPTCEEVFHLARHRDALPASVRVAAPDFATLRALHSKWTFLDVARAAGARVPDSARVTTLEEARAWAEGAPLVLKPEFSRFGVHVRLYPNGMPSDALPLAPLGAWVAQRFVAGAELCSYSIADRGRLLAHAAYRPTYRLATSASYYFAPVANDAVRAIVATLVEQLGYTGQIAFDWIDDGQGAPVVLECNPRAVSGLHLFTGDDPVPAALAGEAVAPFAPGHDRAAMLGALMLGAGLPRALAQGTFAQWRADWARADDVLARPGDRVPFAGALVDMGAFARLALRRGCSLREASTRDIEWDGEPLPAP